ncbi:MAG TPA: hypothetical protein VD927_00540 [Chryseosolibacter sp.]|nr:hypothetical protein [Chryseosolibacter sp.]
MIIIRFLVIAFNVAVVTFLIVRILQVLKQPVSARKKTVIIAGAVILLLAPFGIFFGFFRPTFQYFLIYPVAIGLYIYMIREIA